MNAPGRPRFLAAPLLAAAIVLFWLCFALPEWLMPDAFDEKRLAWPEGAAQSVRRVVVDQSQTGERYYVPGIRLTWSATQAPEIKIDRAVGGEAGHETARIGAQLGVGPDAAAGQIRHGRAVRVAVRIAFKAGGPGESALDDLAQGRRVVVGVGGLDGQRHLRPSSC